jgi:uncharacterized phage protein gp47/JayE
MATENLVPAPDLDIRDEENIAAQAISRISGALTVERIDSDIETLRQLRDLVAAGGLPIAICPELTNANPSAPHTVLIEAFAWLVAQISYKINQLPEKNQIEFARLFNITLREATKATTTLTFTIAPPLNTTVVIPAGTQVETEDGLYIFTTTVEKIIPYGSADKSVLAERSVAGRTLLSPGVLTRMVDPVAWVTAVTNSDAVDSGSDKETVASALERARNYQRKGERLVSAADIEAEILDNILKGNGVVRAFPFIKDGDFSTNQPGHTSVVVMTRNATAIDAATKALINTSLQKLIGSQFVYIKDPTFEEFDVAASVRLTGISPQSAVVLAVETNLRNFYDATQANFGRPILRSEIIAIIEGTAGVQQIVAQPGGAILAAPVADIIIAPYELPKLDAVTITVVP